MLVTPSHLEDKDSVSSMPTHDNMLQAYTLSEPSKSWHHSNSQQVRKLASLLCMRCHAANAQSHSTTDSISFMLAQSTSKAGLASLSEVNTGLQSQSIPADSIANFAMCLQAEADKALLC